MKTSWIAPSNIALVKYWGKSGNQIPINSSLSMSLTYCHTQTSIEICSSDKLGLDFTFAGERNDKFKQKIKHYLSAISNELTWINSTHFNINSINSFPHSAGIASSASFFASLAIGLVDLNNQLGFSHSIDKAFASHLARLGSGSAARSIGGGMQLWRQDAKSAQTVSYSDYFKDLADYVFVIDESEKKVSSSLGHQLMQEHCYKHARIKQAEANLSKLLSVLQGDDFFKFQEIVENEALSLHALMMSSRPGYILMQPNTLKMINLIQEYRLDNTARVCFTLDAGANLHLVFKKSDLSLYTDLITELTSLCHFVIKDEIGQGVKVGE
jgi:diphosphomevalonate decarboxylase